MVKLTDRCFCCFTAAMLVPLWRAPTWRFHTKLYKFGWNTFPNNARLKERTELNLGNVFYVWPICHIPDSWLNSLNGYDFYFWLRDTANQPSAFFPSWKNILFVDSGTPLSPFSMLKYALWTLPRDSNIQKGREGRNVKIGDWKTHAFNKTGFLGGSVSTTFVRDCCCNPPVDCCVFPPCVSRNLLWFCTSFRRNI